MKRLLVILLFVAACSIVAWKINALEKKLQDTASKLEELEADYFGMKATISQDTREYVEFLIETRLRSEEDVETGTN